MAEEFSKYFITKIDDIRCELDANTPVVDNDLPSNSIISSAPILSEFRVVSPEEVKKLVNSSATKSCPLDAIPTTLLKQCLDVFLPHLTKIVNMSVKSGTFLPNIKLRWFHLF